MTRETKLGLVVACSFVALTAVVVVGRLKQKTPALPDAPPPVARGAVVPPPVPPVQPPARSAPPPRVRGEEMAPPPGVIPAAAVSSATPLQPSDGSGVRAGDGGMGIVGAPPKPALPAAGVRMNADGSLEVPMPGAVGSQVVQEKAPPLPAVPSAVATPPAPVLPSVGVDVGKPASVGQNPPRPLEPTGKPATGASAPLPGAPSGAGGNFSPPLPATLPNGQIAMPPPASLIGNSGQAMPNALPGAPAGEVKRTEKEQKKELPASLPGLPSATLPAGLPGLPSATLPAVPPAPSAGTPLPAVPAPAAVQENKDPSGAPPVPVPGAGVVPPPKPAVEGFLPSSMAVPPVPAPTGVGRSDGLQGGVVPASGGEIRTEREKKKELPGSLPNVAGAPLTIAPPPPRSDALPGAPQPAVPLDGKGPPAVTPPSAVTPPVPSIPVDPRPVVDPMSKAPGIAPAPVAPLPNSVNSGNTDQFGKQAAPPSVAQANLGTKEKANPLSIGNSADLPPVPSSVGGRDPGSPPPLGATGNIGSPPIAVPPPVVAPKPAVAIQPMVKQYDVQSYACKQADTSFEILAQNYYHSQRYAQALLQYNRDYLRGADEVKQNPPRLQPGVVVYFPPAHVLEEEYGKAIPGLTPLPAVAAPPATGSTGAAAPAPLGSERAAVAVPVVPAVRSSGVIPANAQAAPSGTKLYRVQAPEGEPMYLIAQRTLGDSNRWSEILRLNPSIIPERPVPQGTPVVLPGDARVE